MDRSSESGLPVDPGYDDSKLTDYRPDARLGRPGKYLFVRGVSPRMSLDRPPAVRPHAGERVIVAVDVLYPLGDALRADSTLREVCDGPRYLWGTCQPERI
jgi:hypothetical protein